MNKRASSGTASARGGDDGASYEAGVAAARARVNRSLVMRVEKIAATAQLWSLTPWSSVRRYERVHVKGITLRLRQVKGILNFSFVALKKKGRKDGAGAGAAVGRNAAAAAASGGGGNGSVGACAGGSTDGGRRNVNFGGGGAVGPAGGFVGAAAPGQSCSGSMEDLDDIDTDGEYATDADTDEQEEEEKEEEDDDHGYEHEPVDDDAELPEEVGGSRGRGGAGSSGGVAGAGGKVDNVVSEVNSRRRLQSDPRSSSSSSSSSTTTTDEASLRPQAAKTFGGTLGGGARRKQAPWAAGISTGSAADTGAHSSGGDGGTSDAPGELARSMSVSVGRKNFLSSSSSSENLGNLGVFKVLGEAFMRRFNAYSDQVLDSNILFVCIM